MVRSGKHGEGVGRVTVCIAHYRRMHRQNCVRARARRLPTVTKELKFVGM